MTFDVVFPLLHGPYGEDGTVQGLFELAGLPYVGAGVLASAVGMDKIMMKRAFAAAGVPSRARLSRRRDGHDRRAFADAIEAELGYPCFVKPSNMGSSVGVSKARDRAELDAAIAHAFAFDLWILVEEAVVGREIEVAVLGDDPPEVSVPGEVVPGPTSTTTPTSTKTARPSCSCPHRSRRSRRPRCAASPRWAFEACRGESMARVDCFVARRRERSS